VKELECLDLDRTKIAEILPMAEGTPTGHILVLLSGSFSKATRYV
jgi:hypothetical protein